ncbi:cytochrome P450 [Mycena olivaceomarginata]|nr:cytochrome P450 [Mycena olivaceomarginata]
MDVKKRMEKDLDLECFAARVWEQQEKLGIDDEEVIYIAGSAFASGTRTSMANLLWFVMAMALHPVQQKSPTGDRLRLQCGYDSRFLEDEGSAVLFCAHQGTHQAPGAPLSFPHYLDVDDEYKGYHIRKGTTVISSVWNTHHSEAEFPNSYTFDPERFLNKDHGVEGLGERHIRFRIRPTLTF